MDEVVQRANSLEFGLAAYTFTSSPKTAMPASIGSIPTDANQEDFVPMGMAAAWKAQRILANAQRVVAAELLCAAQGLEVILTESPGYLKREFDRESGLALIRIGS